MKCSNAGPREVARPFLLHLRLERGIVGYGVLSLQQKQAPMGWGGPHRGHVGRANWVQIPPRLSQIRAYFSTLGIQKVNSCRLNSSIAQWQCCKNPQIPPLVLSFFTLSPRMQLESNKGFGIRSAGIQIPVPPLAITSLSLSFFNCVVRLLQTHTFKVVL